MFFSSFSIFHIPKKYLQEWNNTLNEHACLCKLKTDGEGEKKRDN